MIRITKLLLAAGLFFVGLGTASAGPGKGKGGGKGRGGGGYGRVGVPPGHGGIPPGHGGIPPGQAKKAYLGSAFGPMYSGGYYRSPFYPNYYGGSHYPNYYGGSFYRPYYSNSGFWPGLGVGLALGGLSNLPYRSFGGYSPYYYPTGSVLPAGYVGNYSAPATAAVAGLPAVLDPTAVPATAGPTPVPAPTPTGAAPVHLTVRVPDGARVWVADAPSNQTGPAQTFVSPPVEPGMDYTYVVRAAWTENGQPVSRMRRVTVHAGDRVTVDMTQPE
ncbi:MAG TPA: TIGR03000 domain-containing protein [Fimbriiglobus sp.]|nr:TIGR03000 domain-containing protein [Fimbriiglobus sp.]